MSAAHAFDSRPPRRRWILFAFGLGLSTSALTLVARPSSAASPPNVVLIVVDTLRADALGSYGAEVRTPAIDAIAAAGLRYSRAVAQAPWTVPSLSSLLTSQYPSQHGEGARVSAASEAGETLAERLRARGYATAAFVEVDTPLLRRGFDSFEVATGTTEERYARAAENASHLTFDRAREWLRADLRQPFFLMVHTFALHDYFLGAPPALEYARRHYPDYDGPLRRWRPRPVAEAAGPKIVEDLLASDAADVRFARALYQGALLEVDREIGRLDAVLAEQDRQRSTLVVLTSDHGEGFAPELGRVHHGGRLHDDLLHVPLILRWPAEIEAGVEETQVESIDVAPTVLALAGAAGAESRKPSRSRSQMNGRALLRRAAVDGGSGPAFEPTDDAPALAFAEESAFVTLADGRREPSDRRQVALYEGTRKIIRSDASDEVYDLASDALERRDLSGSDPLLRARLTAELDRVEGSLGTTTRKDPREVERTLRALGYVE